jgi:hypothetical protein
MGLVGMAQWKFILKPIRGRENFSNHYVLNCCSLLVKNMEVKGLTVKQILENERTQNSRSSAMGYIIPEWQREYSTHTMKN